MSRPWRAALCLLLVAWWPFHSGTRGEILCGESGVLFIENDGCGDSGLFAIDNGGCSESQVFSIDNCQSPADLNSDGHVDQADLVLFVACVSAPSTPFVEGCGASDFDGDGDVDQSDYGVLQGAFGSNPSAGSCDD
ncbi:MAG: hypothetical protein AMXMBFR13_42190 [Phycisphaerae bacterium]